jgi:hypothetical protein
MKKRTSEFNHLQDPEEFARRFRYHAKKTDTYIQAYFQTEKDYIKSFGKTKYSSYDSFRMVYTRMLKKQENNA